MSGGIYVLQDNGELVTLSERQYDSEDLLQTLLAKYPSILAGDQINPSSPRNWLLVKREAAVPDAEGGGGRWSLDHLFLDQDGVPTLVEVKRSNDTRIRREVVGQMLDYAANAVAFWSINTIISNFEHTCTMGGVAPDVVLSEFLGPDEDPNGFWDAVKTNLQAGRLRLLFVADEIPDELSRVIEFLNVQMDSVEVLGVEIKQFAGENLKTLVPRIIGRTAEAKLRKGAVRATRQWNEQSFFSALESSQGPEAAMVARRILDWVLPNVSRIWWGKGAQMGSLVPVLDYGGNWYSPFALWTYGVLETHFQYAASKPPFDHDEKRRELLRRWNEIPGVTLPDDAIDKRPSIRLTTFSSDTTLQKLFEVTKWFLDEARSSMA